MDNRSIDILKGLTLDIIQNTHSCNIGIGLSSAPIMFTLFTKHLKVNPSMPHWVNRDRFVMSANHGSALLYATLFLSGYQLTIDDLKNYRKLNSKTPGHPDLSTLGVDVATGLPGEGFATSIGIALAEKIYEEKYNKKPKKMFEKMPLPLVNYYTYVLVSEIDLMEGISYEAASFAGNYNLGKLIVLYDSNKVTMDSKTDITFNEDVLLRFSSLGWDTHNVKNGNSVSEIDKAIKKAKKSTKPSIIKINTTTSIDPKNTTTNMIYSGELSKNDYDQIRVKLKLEGLPFTLIKEPAENIRNQVVNRGIKEYDQWEKIYNDYKKDMTGDQISEFDNITFNKVNFDLTTLNVEIDYDKKELLRDSNCKIMNLIPMGLSNFIGGSADAVTSTKTYLNGRDNLTPKNYLGKNIYFGERENSMGAIINGLALSGFRPFASTYLVSSDNMKPSIRMSALMNLPVTYIFTHDSITASTNGPVYQPVEQLASLRSIPNLYVYRPCDIKEIVGTWNCIIKDGKPAVISLAKTEVKPQKNTKAVMVSKGAYVVSDPDDNKIDAVIIATGAEVQVAVSIKEQLKIQNINIRVVSMTCMEKFDEQSEGYKLELFPRGAKTFVLEYGSSFGWEKFVISSDYLFTIDKFGKSGSKDEVLNYFEVNLENIIERIKKLI